MKFVASPAVDRSEHARHGIQFAAPLRRFARVTAKSATLKAADAVNNATFCLSQNRCSLATGAPGCRGDGRMTGDAASTARLGVAEGALGSAPVAAPCAQRERQAQHTAMAEATRRTHSGRRREVIRARRAPRAAHKQAQLGIHAPSIRIAASYSVSAA
jgi:hypothetical protein